MPSSKEVSGCKHPNSRKTAALAKKTNREKKKSQNKLGQYIKQNVIGEKIMWFKDNLPDEECAAYSIETVRDLIETYLARLDEELESIRLKNSIGGRRNRQHASREEVLVATKQRELQEYRGCGLQIPDLTDSSQVQLLRSWNGELRYLQNFRLRSFRPKL